MNKLIAGIKAAAPGVWFAALTYIIASVFGIGAAMAWLSVAIAFLAGLTIGYATAVLESLAGLIKK